jgi:hypothetical protein
MAKRILIKAVRVRGNRIPNVQGGFDGKLEIYKEGKDISLHLLSIDGDTIFYLTKFPNSASEDLNTLIDRYLSQGPTTNSASFYYSTNPPNFKVIQDPFNPSIIPFQNVPPSPPPVEPKPTPEKVEEKRLQTASNDQVVLDQQDNTDNLDAKKIEKATPATLKAMGIAKLPFLLLLIGNQVKKIITPALKNLIDTYIKKFLDADICPDAATLAKIRQQRDLIVGQLNKIGKTLNIITISLTGIATFLNLLQVFLKAIDLAKIAAKIAALAFPPLAAALPPLLATLTNAKTAALIDPTTGNSRLQKLTSIIGGAALVASIIGGFILVAIALLKSIDAFLEKCDPDNMNSLTPISKEIQDIADAQLQADNTQNETTYQGFIFDIEIVPYTPTVDRRRAVGKNQSGIVLIQTELSFTTDDQTLINELKLIIDRDNLKAY